MNAITSLSRRIENLIRPGTVAELDLATARCRVRTGNLLTTWLPFFTFNAGEDSTWHPPSLDEQCLILSPSGNPETGFVLIGLYSDRYPAPDNSPTRHRRRYRDGALINYDTATHTLTATLPAGGQIVATAPGGMRLIGDLEVDGLITATQDVIAGEQRISLTTHKTAGIQKGTSISDGPVP
ncbi:phage baseplate assembly protein V [Pseudomonas coleopterorum]|uniref:Phage baseplate assembly protein V n=1 Tax=Pseudomonas coleopterorum TaxID=1605838 RepID=A0AAJ6M282_9PSED|nr:phage baseplate assembly protein V [Pseudomonas coleopterorum]WNC11644.1 phage baseplate assembly protein V [Pseudomonas coleopterorum]